MARTRTSLPRTHYRTTTESTKLPFVRKQEHANNSRSTCYWAVDSVDDYGDACDLGMEYAAHYLQYLQDNSSAPLGTPLNWIVRDIDFNNPKQRGIWIGFFSFIQKILTDRARTMNVYATLDAINARHDAICAEIDEYDRITELEED